MESSNVKDVVGINKKRSFTDTNEMLKVKIRTFANVRKSSSFFSLCDEKLFKEFSPKITCRKKHPLSFMSYIFYSEKFKCELCSSVFYCVGGAWRCGKCKFDYCSKCYMSFYKTKDEKNIEPSKKTITLSEEAKNVISLNEGLKLIFDYKSRNFVRMKKTDNGIPQVVDINEKCDSKWEGNLFVFESPDCEKICILCSKCKNIKITTGVCEFQLVRFLIETKSKKKFILSVENETSLKLRIEEIRKQTTEMIILRIDPSKLKEFPIINRLQKELKNIKIASTNNEAYQLISENEETKIVKEEVKEKVKEEKETKSIEEIMEIYNTEEFKEYEVTVPKDSTVGVLRKEVGLKLGFEAEKAILLCGRDELKEDNSVLSSEKIHSDKGILVSYDPNPALFFLEENRNSFDIDSQRLSARAKHKASEKTILGNKTFNSGRYYWEVKIEKSLINNITIGVATEKVDKKKRLGEDSYGFGYVPNNCTRHKNMTTDYAKNCNSKSESIRRFVVGVFLDMNQRTLSFLHGGRGGKYSGKYTGNAFTNLPDNVFPAFSLESDSSKISLSSFIKDQTSLFSDINTETPLVLPRGRKSHFVVSVSPNTMSSSGILTGDVGEYYKIKEKVIVGGLVIYPEKFQGKILLYSFPFSPENHYLVEFKSARREIDVVSKALPGHNALELLHNTIFGYKACIVEEKEK